MWRRLCVDVDDDGDIVGASVEFWSDADGERHRVMVMEPDFWASRSLSQVIRRLQEDGWSTPPLRLIDLEGKLPLT